MRRGASGVLLALAVGACAAAVPPVAPPLATPLSRDTWGGQRRRLPVAPLPGGTVDARLEAIERQVRALRDTLAVQP
jgi:hypothetical protein